MVAQFSGNDNKGNQEWPKRITTKMVNRIERKLGRALYRAKSPHIEIRIGNYKKNFLALVNSGAEINTISVAAAVASNLIVSRIQPAMFGGNTISVSMANGAAH